MTNEEKTQNLFIANNDIEPLMTYKRGILVDTDEYKRKVDKVSPDEKHSAV